MAAEPGPVGGERQASCLGCLVVVTVGLAVLTLFLLFRSPGDTPSVPAAPGATATRGGAAARPTRPGAEREDRPGGHPGCAPGHYVGHRVVDAGGSEWSGWLTLSGRTGSILSRRGDRTRCSFEGTGTADPDRTLLRTAGGCRVEIRCRGTRASVAAKGAACATLCVPPDVTWLDGDYERVLAPPPPPEALPLLDLLPGYSMASVADSIHAAFRFQGIADSPAFFSRDLDGDETLDHVVLVARGTAAAALEEEVVVLLYRGPDPDIHVLLRRPADPRSFIQAADAGAGFADPGTGEARSLETDAVLVGRAGLDTVLYYFEEGGFRPAPLGAPVP